MSGEAGNIHPGRHDGDATDSTDVGIASLRVLHVTGALGGGVITALRSMLHASDQHVHDLVYMERGAFHTAESLAPPFHNATRVVGRPTALWRQVHRELRRQTPDVVHAHSAWAGLVVRTQIGTSRARPPVVYSPHSYFFERTTLNRLARLAARTTERLLARRTDVAACVSPHEVRLSSELGHRAMLLPNVVALDPDLEAAASVGSAGKSPAVRLATVGRLAPQKDPMFFRDVVRATRGAGLDAEWTWFGAGDAAVRRLLEAEGVRVTGWKARSDVLAELSGMNAYVHTAAWEGSPMTLLEAAALGLPIVARSIDALTSLGYPADLTRPVDLAEALVRLVKTGVAPETPPAATRDHQRAALDAIYAAARR